MKTELRTDLTIKEICDGFLYQMGEERAVCGWGGKLTNQPEYQRNYIYNTLFSLYTPHPRKGATLEIYNCRHRGKHFKLLEVSKKTETFSLRIHQM